MPISPLLSSSTLSELPSSPLELWTSPSPCDLDVDVDTDLDTDPDLDPGLDPDTSPLQEPLSIPPPPELSFRTEDEAWVALYKHGEKHGYGVRKHGSRPAGDQPKRVFYLVCDKARDTTFSGLQSGRITCT